MFEHYHLTIPRTIEAIKTSKNIGVIVFILQDTHGMKRDFDQPTVAKLLFSQSMSMNQSPSAGQVRLINENK